MSKLVVVLLVIGVIMAGFFLFGSSKKSESNALSHDVIEGELAEGALLVDVRTPEEFAQEHASGAVNVPLQEIEQGNFAGLDKGKKLYLYCRSGNRASQAEAILRSNGYDEVVNLGGLGDWKALCSGSSESCVSL